MADNDHVDVHLLFTEEVVSILCVMMWWRGSRHEASRLTYPMMAVVCVLVYVEVEVK